MCSNTLSTFHLQASFEPSNSRRRTSRILWSSPVLYRAFAGRHRETHASKVFTLRLDDLGIPWSGDLANAWVSLSRPCIVLIRAGVGHLVVQAGASTLRWQSFFAGVEG